MTLLNSGALRACTRRVNGYGPLRMVSIVCVGYLAHHYEPQPTSACSARRCLPTGRLLPKPHPTYVSETIFYVAGIGADSFFLPVQYMNIHLNEADPEVFNIIELEKRRQRESIVLIPSEVHKRNP